MHLDRPLTLSKMCMTNLNSSLLNLRLLISVLDPDPVDL
jgi:hypothetical protein